MYLRDRLSLKELKKITREWVEFYNKERLYQPVRYKIPDDVLL